MTLRSALLLSFCLSAPALAFAQNLQPLPSPDLSRLPAAQNAELREVRANFERESKKVSGIELAEMYGDLGGFYARAALPEVALVAFQNASKVVPADDRWVYLQAVMQRALGRGDEANRLFQQALKLNPAFLPTRMSLVVDHMRRNDLAGARKLLEESLTINPGQPSPQAMLGEIAYREKRHADAIRYIKAALTLDPEANSLYTALARAEQAAGNAEAAKAAQAKAGDVPPRLDDPLIQRMRPMAAAEAGAQAPAAGSDEAVFGEASRLLAEGKPEDARKVLDEALKRKPGDALLLTSYARFEASLNRPEAAKARARAAVAADPKSQPAWATQGLVLEMAGDDKGARDAYQRAIALDAKTPFVQILAGDLALRTGRAADAMISYRAAVTASPDAIGGWARLLAAEFATGQCQVGLKETTDNATRMPHDMQYAELAIRAASTCRAASAAQRQKALADAEKLYQAARSDVAQVSEAYALALAANGKWDDAVQTQGGALFDSVRGGDKAATEQYREFYQRFQAKQLPDMPWASTHVLLKPQRPAPPPPAPAAATPVKPAGG